MSLQAGRRLTAALVVAATVLAACSGDDQPDSSGAGSEPASGSDVVAGEAFPESRCEANRAAGTITYLSGFDFAAAAGIVEVLVADDRGYYEELCLDVEITPSLSTDNDELVAGGRAQMASGGSFSEVVLAAQSADVPLRAISVAGRGPIDVLIAKPGPTELADFEGTTIGVKAGRLPPSIAAMLATAGLAEGEDYETVPVDGFDPLVHIEIRRIDGFPGYRSNEVGQLERAGNEFETFDPIDADVPGSFGVIFTNDDFLNEHPTAAQDFMRATMKGLADAIADPAAASAVSVDLINGGGNPYFLSPEGETYRWRTEAGLTAEGDLAPGVIDPEALQAELDAYTKVGLFEEAPESSDFTADVLTDVYADDDTIIWPATD